MLKLLKQLWTKVKYVFVKTDTKAEELVKVVKKVESNVVEDVKKEGEELKIVAKKVKESTDSVKAEVAKISKPKTKKK